MHKLSISNRFRGGFTIIEVIIVLVIAAIIMVMVFLVVPQLQRVQRNTRRQTFARQVLSAIHSWYANNPNWTSGPTTDNILAITGSAYKDPTTGSVSLTAYNRVSAATAPDALGKLIYITGGSKCSSGSYTDGSGASVIVYVEPSTTWCVTDSL